MQDTIDYAGMQWQVRSHSWTPYAREYCADGDGIVTVCERLKGCFKGFLVFDQFDYAGKHDTLQAALDHATSILKNDYPAIFADQFFNDDDSGVMQ